jgi:hypothetical protein
MGIVEVVLPMDPTFSSAQISLIVVEAVEIVLV